MELPPLRPPPAQALRRLRVESRSGAAPLKSRRRPLGERRLRGALVSLPPRHRPQPRPGGRSSQERRAPEPPAAPPPATKSGPGSSHRGPEEPPARAAHYQQLRQEVLKTKMGKLEKITVAHSQPSHVHKCELSINRQKGKCNAPFNKTALAERHEPACQQDSTFFGSLKQEKPPLHCTDNLSEIKLNKSFSFSGLSDKEVSYAGAKFSDPPSPSVLPKPPRHWVGTTTVQRSQQCKELMAVHLKTLLKVQA